MKGSIIRFRSVTSVRTKHPGGKFQNQELNFDKDQVWVDLPSRSRLRHVPQQERIC